MSSAKNRIWQVIKYLAYPGVPASLCIILGTSVLVRSVSDYQAADNFWDKAIETTGTIVETRRESRMGSSGGLPMSYAVDISTIQFVTQQGETITFEGDNDICVNRLSSSPCEGKEVGVVYNSSNPHQVIVEGSPSPENRAKFGIGWGILITFVGIVMIAAPTQQS